MMCQCFDLVAGDLLLICFSLCTNRPGGNRPHTKNDTDSSTSILGVGGAGAGETQRETDRETKTESE